MEEIWSDIPGYEGMYQISNHGRVKSLERYDTIGRRLKEKYLSNILGKNGYYYTTLTVNSVYKHPYIHRLVAEAFIPNPEGKPCIDHIDGDTTNNDISNLRWCTHQENCSYPLTCSRKVESHPTIGKVYQYDSDMTLVGEYDGICAAARATGLAKTHISANCHGKAKTCGGYLFSFHVLS